MVDIQNVSFRYEGAQTESIQEITLHIDQGECVVLTGGSGCGKTTVTRLVNGLVPHFYEGELSGHITVSGLDVAANEPYRLSPVVGSVFQNPRTQFFNTDTDSEIVFGMENIGLSYEEMHRRFDNTVEYLELQQLTGRNIFALSGGEKQIIAFAGVYALSPEVYVLDEPSSNLDNAAIERLRQLLIKVKSMGKTLLVAEHRLYYLQGLADRIVFMEEGSIKKEWTSSLFSAKSTVELGSLGLRPFTPTPLALSESTKETDILPALEVQNLSICHQRKKPVISDLNFSVKPGEIVGIVGNNGQGKTTLARTICGLLRENLGQVLFDGKPVFWKKRNTFAYLVMQDPNYQLISESVAKELLLTANNRKAQEERDIRTIAKELSIHKLFDRHPLSLSGGQKQRVSIALAALSPAKILVFDEPTSGLDYGNMQRVAETLKMLSDHGKAILLISHDHELLAQVCKRIISLSPLKTEKEEERKESLNEQYYVKYKFTRET